MKIKLLQFFLIILCVFFLSEVRAQKLNNLSFALTSETYSFPFTRILPVHPGIEVGTSIFQRVKNNSQHNINAFIGGYHHQKIENAFYLRSEYRYRYKIKNTIGIDIPVGVGYQHKFYPGEIYEQNPSTGEWENKNQIGKSHFLVTFGLGLTYINASRIQPFVKYESNIDIPLYNGFLTTRTFIKFGVNIKLNQHENK